jgi:hypothetical protein
MLFSVSNLTKNLSHEVQKTKLFFGEIEKHLPKIHTSLVNQFFGNSPTLLLIGGESDQTETSIINFSDFSPNLSEQQKGAHILDVVAQKITLEIARTLDQSDEADPAILSAAYHIAAHLGFEEFRDLAACVAEKSGIHLQGVPEHAIEISIGEDSSVYVCRRSRWTNVSINDQPVGPLITDWTLACKVSETKPGNYVLLADVVELGLFRQMHSDKSKQEDAFAKLELPPSLFVTVVNAFLDSLREVLNYFSFWRSDVRLDYVAEYFEHDTDDAITDGVNYQGWRALRDDIRPQLSARVVGPHTATLVPMSMFKEWFATSMEWSEKPSRSYQEEKFAFSYSNPDLTRAEKLQEEDQYALTVLQSPETIENVKMVGKLVADFLEKTIVGSISRRFFILVECLLPKLKGTYPFAKAPVGCFDELLNVLRTHDNHVVILSLIWPIVMRNKESAAFFEEIDSLYRNVVVKTQKYIYDPEMMMTPVSNRFGNSKTVQSDIFSEDFFYPFSRSVDYIIQSPVCHNRIIKKMNHKGIPFVSGLSGMANQTCKALHSLHLHPYSEQGKIFCEAMSAFIVGSGMHSYYEVYKSFNLYAKMLDTQFLQGNFT